MAIKRGYFATLYDDSEYETINIKKDRNGNYRLRSTNPDDLNNGFRKYNDTVFVKIVSENEVKKIEHIQPYAIFKNDPDKNKFSIIEKNDGDNYEDKLVLATTNYELARNFGFGPCGFGPGTYEKTVSMNEIDIKYLEKEIFLSTPNRFGPRSPEKPASKDEAYIKHEVANRQLETKIALMPMSINTTRSKELPLNTQEMGFRLI